MAKRLSKFASNTTSKNTSGIRIDKWLWAARFFKTRSIAKNAIEGGKVHINGERVKVSREVQIGMQLTIQQGIDKKTVIVKGLSDIRGSAPIAQQLYEETADSIAKREQQAEQRKMANIMYMSTRPTKKDRRSLDRFQQQLDSDILNHEIDDRFYDDFDDSNGSAYAEFNDEFDDEFDDDFDEEFAEDDDIDWSNNSYSLKSMLKEKYW